jgi:hypothetical protein
MENINTDPANTSALEEEFNKCYQATLAFYEKAQNGDRTHPFVLFKISQLKQKKSVFKLVKDIDSKDPELAKTLRLMFIEDIKQFVASVKEYELKMRSIKEASKKKKKFIPKNRQGNGAKRPYNNRTSNTRPRSNNTGSRPYNSSKPRNTSYGNNNNTRRYQSNTSRSYGGYSGNAGTAYSRDDNRESRGYTPNSRRTYSNNSRPSYSDNQKYTGRYSVKITRDGNIESKPIVTDSKPATTEKAPKSNAKYMKSYNYKSNNGKKKGKK